MALIKCPECGKEISDTVTQCPHCGFQIKQEKTINKKLIIIPIIAVLLLIAIIGIINIAGNNKSPAKQAIKIIESDYGKNVEISAIYYSEEQNGCIIEFSSNSIADVACINLEDNSIGYESEYEELGEKMTDRSISEKERQKYALQVIEYPYDATWVYNVTVNGASGSDWEKIQ